MFPTFDQYCATMKKFKYTRHEPKLPGNRPCDIQKQHYGFVEFFRDGAWRLGLIAYDSSDAFGQSIKQLIDCEFPNCTWNGGAIFSIRPVFKFTVEQ
jgi:hypothetical protein